MSFTKSIFLLGATGYIGGSLLVSLLKEYPHASITVLVRKPQAGEIVKSLSPDRITVVYGSHSDNALIQAQVEKADLVINAADSDDVGFVKSLVSAFKNKSKKGVLIHTSGSANVIPEGPYDGKLSELGHKVWEDTNTEDLRGIPASALHREVDLVVHEAHDAGNVDTYIICPGLIYGIGAGPIKTVSAQLPALVQIALRRREVVYIGEGSNIWCNIHIQDLIRLYLHLINHAFRQLEASAKVDAYNNFYFAATGESSLKELADSIAPLLHGKGLVNSPYARGVTADEEQMLSLFLGHTSRAVSKRGTLLGWSPEEQRLSEPEVLKTEIEHILKVVPSSA